MRRVTLFTTTAVLTLAAWGQNSVIQLRTGEEVAGALEGTLVLGGPFGQDRPDSKHSGSYTGYYVLAKGPDVISISSRGVALRPGSRPRRALVSALKPLSPEVDLIAYMDAALGGTDIKAWMELRSPWSHSFLELKWEVEFEDKPEIVSVRGELRAGEILPFLELNTTTGPRKIAVGDIADCLKTQIRLKGEKTISGLVQGLIALGRELPPKVIDNKAHYSAGYCMVEGRHIVSMDAEGVIIRSRAPIKRSAFTSDKPLPEPAECLALTERGSMRKGMYQLSTRWRNSKKDETSPPIYNGLLLRVMGQYADGKLVPELTIENESGLVKVSITELR
ncbi:MAG: hypothetical protein ABSC08_18560 [Bryobacteraceae bacterium]|jgi:hypothetical protein